MSRKKAKNRGGQSQGHGNKTAPAENPTPQIKKMPYPKDQAKRKAPDEKFDDNDESAKRPRLTLSPSGAKPSTTTAKRPRSTNDTNSELEPSPMKKARFKSPVDISTSEATVSSKDKPTETPGDRPATTDEVRKAKIDSLPIEVRHMASQYDFTPMSIISSSKMEQKIRTILERVGNFSFADPATKPGVVVLHAKVEAASKMVGIAEVVKREIEKSKGRCWQYSKLEGQILERKTKPSHRIGGGVTLQEWGAQQLEAKRTTNTNGEADLQPEAKDGSSVESGEDEEAAFETMAPLSASTEMGILSHDGRRRIRATPVMTIYLSQVPVPGLETLYGEQTNSKG